MCRHFKFAKNIYSTIGIILAVTQVFTWFFLGYIIYFLVCHLKEGPNLSQTSTHEIRTAVTFSIIALICTFLTVPYIILQSFESLMENVSQTTRTSLGILPIFTCVINPIVYLFRIERLRKLLMKSVRLLCCKQKITPVSTINQVVTWTLKVRRVCGFRLFNIL